LRFARLSFGGLGVRVALLLLGLELLYFGLERIDLRFKRSKLISREVLSPGAASCPEQRCRHEDANTRA
jgi:hypothetical protein